MQAVGLMALPHHVCGLVLKVLVSERVSVSECERESESESVFEDVAKVIGCEDAGSWFNGITSACVRPCPEGTFVRECV